MMVFVSTCIILYLVSMVYVNYNCNTIEKKKDYLIRKYILVLQLFCIIQVRNIYIYSLYKADTFYKYTDKYYKLFISSGSPVQSMKSVALKSLNK